MASNEQVFDTRNMSVGPDGQQGYPALFSWQPWIDEHMRCRTVGVGGRCELVREHAQPHAVVLVVEGRKRAWRWSGAEGWLDDGGAWGNVATDRAPWMPGWP